MDYILSGNCNTGTMKNRKILLVIITGFICRFSLAQDPAIIEKYINTYKNLAIEEMQRTGVPAAIKLAQGIHETMAGTSDLVLKSNNHFGIKCKDTWKGASVKHDDDLKNECFRKYPTAIDSYRDHSDFLKGSSRYAALFKLDPTDYKGWANGLKKAGYATNPRYPQVIIKLIEDYNLEDYTLVAMGKMKLKDETVAKNDPVISQSQTVKVGATTKPAEPVFVETVKTGPMKPEIKTYEVKTQARTMESEPAYPASEFKINETRVVFAKKGTPLLALAQQYNISLAWLYDFNDMPATTESLTKNQLIYLQRKRKTGLNEMHIVKPGESLYDIAQTEAIRLESLLGYNMLNIEMQPAIGESLYLRTKAPSKPRLALKENYSLKERPDPVAMDNNPGKSSGSQFISEKYNHNETTKAELVNYTVQPKETAWAIAQKYKVNIEDLIKWNQLQGTDLRAGQQLKIYK